MKKFCIVFLILNFLLSVSLNVKAESYTSLPSEHYKVLAKAYDDFEFKEYWAYPFLWAIDEKIINGYNNSKHPITKKLGNWLNPNGSLTQSQMLTILIRYFKKPELNLLLNKGTNIVDAVYEIAQKQKLEIYGDLFLQKNGNKVVNRGDMAITFASLHYNSNKSIEEATQFIYKSYLGQGYSNKNGEYLKTVETFGKDDLLKRAHLVTLLYKYDEFKYNQNIITSDTFEIWPYMDENNIDLRYYIHPTSGKRYSLGKKDFNGQLILLNDALFGVEIISEERNGNLIDIWQFNKYKINGEKEYTLKEIEEGTITVITDGVFFYSFETTGDYLSISNKISKFNPDGNNTKIIWSGNNNHLGFHFYYYNGYIYFEYSEANNFTENISVKMSTNDFNVEELIRYTNENFLMSRYQDRTIFVDQIRAGVQYYFYDMINEAYITTEFPNINAYRNVKILGIRGKEVILEYRRYDRAMLKVDLTKEANFKILIYDTETKNIKPISNGALSKNYKIFYNYIEYDMENGSRSKVFF
jgi:hypothetical protein